ncbi:MAG: hypothetical protein ACYDAQ_18685 [Mycobacteriales bacterium]
METEYDDIAADLVEDPRGRLGHLVRQGALDAVAFGREHYDPRAVEPPGSGAMLPASRP